MPHMGTVVAGRAHWMAVLSRRELLISGGTATGLVIDGATAYRLVAHFAIPRLDQGAWIQDPHPSGGG
jgi:hypothetical protein